MLPRLSGSLQRPISIGTLVLPVAVLICLAVVFAGCTSPSSSPELYFMRVNLSEFPRINKFHLPRSIDLPGAASSVSDGATSIGNGATENLNGVAAEVSTAANSAVTKVSSAADAVASEASDGLISLEKKLRSELPAFYTVGLWSYCEGNNTHATFCSSPSVSFTFNVSGILNSVSSGVNEIIPNIGEKMLTGYHEVSCAIIWLYILGFISTTITALLAIRKVFFNRGNKLLIIFGMLSLVLITAGTIGVTIIYGMITAAVKTVLGPFGASAILGSHTLASAWLAVTFSIVVLLVWLVESCCCFLSPL